MVFNAFTVFVGKFFNSESLKEGRNFYKNGVISSLDISSDQVIFIRKVNREETYSVIEWNGKSIDYRTSVDDEFTGCAIAVAGIYELEELIGEIHEIDPMLEEHDFSESVELDSECLSQEVEEEQQRAFSHNLIIKLEISSRKGLTATPFGKMIQVHAYLPMILRQKISASMWIAQNS